MSVTEHPPSFWHAPGAFTCLLLTTHTANCSGVKRPDPSVWRNLEFKS